MPMKTERELQSILSRIDGRGYKAYKDIQGSYRFPNFMLCIDHVQGDPFASPSRIRIQISQTVSRFPEALFRSAPRKIGLEDYLTRIFDKAIRSRVKTHQSIDKMVSEDVRDYIIAKGLYQDKKSS